MSEDRRRPTELGWGYGSAPWCATDDGRFWSSALFYLSDLIFLLDIFVQLRTSVVDPETQEENLSSLVIAEDYAMTTHGGHSLASDGPAAIPYGLLRDVKGGRPYAALTTVCRVVKALLALNGRVRARAGPSPRGEIDRAPSFVRMR